MHQTFNSDQNGTKNKRRFETALRILDVVELIRSYVCSNASTQN